MDIRIDLRMPVYVAGAFAIGSSAAWYQYHGPDTVARWQLKNHPLALSEYNKSQSHERNLHVIDSLHQPSTPTITFATLTKTTISLPAASIDATGEQTYGP